MSAAAQSWASKLSPSPELELEDLGFFVRTIPGFYSLMGIGLQQKEGCLRTATMGAKAGMRADWAVEDSWAGFSFYVAAPGDGRRPLQRGVLADCHHAQGHHGDKKM
jgi:hypothetical protein